MSDLVQIEKGILVPRHLLEDMKQEKRLGLKIDPARMAYAINRAIARRQAQEARKQQVKPGEPVVAPPIIVPAPIPIQEALDRTAEYLSQQMAQNGTAPGTVVTLEQVLDRAEAAIVEKAWKNGHPIPREQIRHALEEIRRRADSQRADTRGKR